MIGYEIDELKAAKESLMNSAQQVFAKVYEQQAQQAAGGAQSAGPDMGAATGRRTCRITAVTAITERRF